MGRSKRRCANCKYFMYPDIIGGGYCCMNNKTVWFLECCQYFEKLQRRKAGKAPSVYGE